MPASPATKRERNLAKVDAFLHPSQKANESVTLALMNDSFVTPIGQFVQGFSYPRSRPFIVAALEDVQASYGWVSADAVGRVAEYFSVPVEQVEQILSACRDALFSNEPNNRKLVVCNGPVCCLHGSDGLLQALEKNGLTAEGHCCLGACDHAPAVRCGDMLVAPASLELILQECC